MDLFDFHLKKSLPPQAWGNCLPSSLFLRASQSSWGWGWGWVHGGSLPGRTGPSSPFPRNRRCRRRSGHAPCLWGWVQSWIKKLNYFLFLDKSICTLCYPPWHFVLNLWFIKNLLCPQKPKSNHCFLFLREILYINSYIYFQLNKNISPFYVRFFINTHLFSVK